MSQQINYKLKYKKFIDKRRQRPLIREKGYEIHHIIPKSLNGSNSKKNLVKLTLREHWVAHRLLEKCYTGWRKRKMSNALWYMCRNKEYGFTQREYERNRINFGEFNNKTKKQRQKIRKASINLWQDPVYRAKQIAERQQRKNNKSLAKKMSERTKAYFQDDDNRKRKSEILKKYFAKNPMAPCSNANKEKNRLASIEKWKDPVYRAKQMASRRARFN